MALTYAQLTTAIKNWMENDSTEFATDLDTIIGLAELRIIRETDLDEFKKYATAPLFAADKFIEKPSDFVADRWMKVQDVSTSVYYPMLRKDVSFLNEYWPNETLQGRPKFYADWNDTEFVCAPIPDDAHVVTLAYTYRPAGLSSGNTTSWLGNNASDVLLWACLVEAAAYMKEQPADIQLWEQKYQDAKNSLMMEEIKRQRNTEDRHGEIRGNK